MDRADETIGAFVDGELDAEAAAALTARAAQDAALAGEIERQRALRVRLDEAYGPIADEPAPARLTRLLTEPERPRLAAASPRLRVVGYGLAMAASLVLAVGVTLSLRPAPDVAFSRDGAIVAGGRLARALDGQASGAAPTGTQVMASFRASDGRYCRVFQRRGESTTSGVACHGQAGWTLAALGSAQAEGATAYRQASSSLPPAVAAALDDLGASQPLSAAQELTAMRAGWPARSSQ